MHALRRNKQPFYYRLYLGKSDVYDANGNRTGEQTLTYAAVVKEYGNVSAARGDAGIEQFGIDLAYSRTIVLGGITTPIAEDTTLWVGYGQVAAYGAGVSYSAGDFAIKAGAIQRYDGTTWKEVAPNYRVARVAKSLNSTTIAIREVSANA